MTDTNAIEKLIEYVNLGRDEEAFTAVPAARAELEQMQSAIRDRQQTFEFGADVMNKIVLQRTAHMQPNETALPALMRWINECDQMRDELERVKEELRLLRQGTRFTFFDNGGAFDIYGPAGRIAWNRTSNYDPVCDYKTARDGAELLVAQANTADQLRSQLAAQSARIEAKDIALKCAAIQIRYLHEKFKETGSGNQTLAQIDAALSQSGHTPTNVYNTP